jgi:hypothetical protein
VEYSSISRFHDGIASVSQMQPEGAPDEYQYRGNYITRDGRLIHPRWS